MVTCWRGFVRKIRAFRIPIDKGIGVNPTCLGLESNARNRRTDWCPSDLPLMPMGSKKKLETKN